MGWLEDQWKTIRDAGAETIESLGEGVTAGVVGAIKGAQPESYNQPEVGENGMGRTVTQQQPGTVQQSQAVAGGMPGWVVPVAVGGGVLLFMGVVVLMVRK